MQAFIEMLKPLQHDLNVSGILVDFSSCDSSSVMISVFTSEGSSGMLEDKDYRHVNYVFLYITKIIDGRFGRETVRRVLPEYCTLRF